MIAYHYTDINGFLNIIKNKKLWLSAANNLNDYSESNWLKEKLFQHLKANHTEKNRKLLNDFIRHIELNLPMAYLCSFSKNKDLLSQWRAYSKDGSGVAIGFNLDYFEIKQGYLPVRGLTEDLTTGIHDVCYDTVRQSQHIENAFNRLVDIKGDTPESTSEFIEIISFLCRYALVAKNPAFIEENEVRIIHTPSIHGTQDGGTNIYGNISELQWRTSGKNLTSYFELDFAKSKDTLPIHEIVVGPKSQLTSFDLKTCLSMNGFGTSKLSSSAATYR